jgi:arginine/lysine/ornithine decarboxylase
VGDGYRDIERLVGALSEIRRRYKRDRAGMLTYEYISPEVAVAPQRAFYAEKESVPLEQTVGRVCGECIMSYPPGIPILAPGEVITEPIARYIAYAKEKGCVVTGAQDLKTEFVNVLKG